MTKTLSIAFSQVAQTKEARKFLEDSGKAADEQIQDLSKIMHEQIIYQFLSRGKQR